MNEALATYLSDIERATGVKLFFVGGSVRDEALGVPSSDVDILAWGMAQDELINALSGFGNVEITGALFGVIRFFPFERKFPMMEISLPRKEISIGFGHKDFTVEFDPFIPVMDDLMRRDFTVNAMAQRVSDGRIFGHPMSEQDLEDGVLRVLHPDSAKEDPLRVLRAIRFISKLGFDVEPDTDKALREAVPLLVHVSPERLQDELLKIVVGDHVGKALRYAQEIGVIAEILPELEEGVGCGQNKYHSLDVFNHIVEVVQNTPSRDPYVRLGALFHDVAKPVVKWVGEDGEAHFYDPAPDTVFKVAPKIRGHHEVVGAEMTRVIMRRLKFSNENTNRVVAFVLNHMFIQGDNLRKQAARKLLAKFAHVPGDIVDNMNGLFAIRFGDILGGKVDKVNQDFIEKNQRFYEIVMGELEAKSAFRVSDLAVGGREVMDILGLEPGKEVGEVLDWLFDMVIEDASLNTRDTLIACIEQRKGEHVV